MSDNVKELIPVILSGGAGSRLWPVSRQTLPKPFMRVGASPLLQQAFERGMACGADRALLVTNEAHLFLSRGLLNDMPCAPRTTLLLEPEGRNTAAAIGLAALSLRESHGDDTVMLVLPADHLIAAVDAFADCAQRAAQEAQCGRLVVFGIRPTSPETGFGYIETNQGDSKTQPVLRFVEKPDLLTAQSYLATGRFLWNSGMFCFTAGTLLAALARHCPPVYEAITTAWARAAKESGLVRFDREWFAAIPSISIDHAVMERADNVSVVPATFDWSDVGSWPAVAAASEQDVAGNTYAGDDSVHRVLIDTRDTHIHIESHLHKVVATVGVENLVVIDTPDALLIAAKDRSQAVKHVFDSLRDVSHEATQVPPVVPRPWGNYATLKEEDGYKVKRLVVHPGEGLSLQYHEHRSEHWVVVAGRGRIQINDSTHDCRAGDYRHIPAGAHHRLINDGLEDLVLIEVQCGPYLGEDDIVRLQDRYGRTG